MDQAEILADSEPRKVENIFYPEDIRGTPSTIPPTKQPLITQAPPPNGEVSKRDGVDVETQISTKAKPSEDALTIRDVVSQAKDAELKSQADPKDPPPVKT